MVGAAGMDDPGTSSAVLVDEPGSFAVNNGACIEAVGWYPR